MSIFIPQPSPVDLQDGPEQDLDGLDWEDCDDPDTLHYVLERMRLRYREVSLDLKNLERIQKENEALKYANNALSLKLGTYCRSQFARLPPEILFMISRHALPPRWMLSGTKSMPPYPQDVLSGDLRMKLSLLAVCKSWNKIGTELLYEKVTLRRITQLPVFVRALEGRQGLGPLVKCLDIDCFVPRGYSRLHQNETQRIMELCPKLIHVGFSPCFRIPGLACSLPAMMSSSVTSLEFNSSIPYSTILPSLIEHSQYLKSLALAIPDTEGHPALAFSRLEDLRLKIEWEHSSLLNWHIPRLQRLWLDAHVRVNDDVRVRITNAILDSYGSTLTFVRIGPGYPILFLEQLLDRCPVLDRIHPSSS
ncbi:F-box domain-containing protein [Mycena venus]|uniref:F-box domain-containing protein n=1 Tax=Mycena venus TaxID=2733690 RepID=A0A8H6YFL2_9AGAR|nr:F-box domain-containing protein [Mycena venus]